MADVYKHGIYISETATALQPVSQVANPVVAVGTAIQGPINEPTLITGFSDFVQTFGYKGNYTHFTLEEVAYVVFQLYNVSPVIMINALDPTVHSKNGDKVLTGMTSDQTIKTWIVPGTLVATSGTNTLVEGTDFTFIDGVFHMKRQTNVVDDTVNLTYKIIDGERVTNANIIGGVNSSTGKETGLAAIENVYPRLGLVPGMIICPKFSAVPEVALAMAAKASDINGCFKSLALCDITTEAPTLAVSADIKESPIVDLATGDIAIAR